VTDADDELLRLPDGRGVQLWQGGAADGHPVLFFHGCPDTRWAAHSGADAARRAGVRLIAVNRPGYGGSDAAASDHLSVANDTEAVADLLGLGRFAVLGMSVGGPYALASAATHPERVVAAVVVAAPGDVTAMDPPWHRDDLTDEQQAQLRQVAHSTADQAIELFRPDFAAYVAFVNPDDPDDEALARRVTAELHPLDEPLMQALPAADVAASAREALAQLDGYLRDTAAMFRPWGFDLARVRCPMSVWCGEHDTNHPPRNSRWIADHVHGAELVMRSTAHLGTLIRHWDELLHGIVPAFSG
jgi:pimeloyl-ACP methyl ester carboxylesterase